MCDTEFLLTSSKIVFRASDLTSNELTHYKVYISTEHDMPLNVISDDMLFGVDDPDNEIATDELRVQYWDWNGHTILDINSWPGDNEAGIIVLDGKVIATNLDQYLELEKTCNNMDECIDLLADLRIIVIYEEHELNERDFTTQAIKWRLSTAGKASYEIATLG